jgi:hypothetical protein
MANPKYLESLRATLRDLTRQRQLLDADIRDLARIIQRYDQLDEAESSQEREPGRAARPGEGRRQALELMADGTLWTPTRLGKERGTTPNAASAMLQRLAAERPPAVEREGKGYRIALPKGDDAQGSLSESTERDEQRIRQGVNDESAEAASALG